MVAAGEVAVCVVHGAGGGQLRVGLPHHLVLLQVPEVVVGGVGRLLRQATSVGSLGTKEHPEILATSPSFVPPLQSLPQELTKTVSAWR